MLYETDEAVIQKLKERFSSHYGRINTKLFTPGFYRDCCYYYSAEVEPLLPADKQASILEVGCGAGHLVRFLCDKGYTAVGAIEMDPVLYEKACEYVGKKAQFIVQGDALKYLESRRDVFDVITAIDVIEHFTLAQAAEFCTLACNSLRPGGVLVLRTPNMANILGCYTRYNDLTHQRGDTEASLCELLLLAGFKDAQVAVPKFSWLRRQTFRHFATTILHRLLFAMQGKPCPKGFERNIVICARV